MAQLSQRKGDQSLRRDESGLMAIQRIGTILRPMIIWTAKQKVEVKGSRKSSLPNFSIIDGTFHVSAVEGVFDARFLIPERWTVSDHRCLVCEPVNRGKSLIMEGITGHQAGATEPPRFLLEQGIAILALGWQSELMAGRGLLRCTDTRLGDYTNTVLEEHYFLFWESRSCYFLNEPEVRPTTINEVNLKSVELDFWNPEERTFVRLARSSWIVASTAFLAVRISQQLPSGTVIRARFRKRQRNAVSVRGLLHILDAVKRLDDNPLGAIPRNLILCGFSLTARLIRAMLGSALGQTLKHLTTGIYLHGAGSRGLELLPDLTRESLRQTSPIVSPVVDRLWSGTSINGHEHPRVFISNTSTEYWFADAALESSKGINVKQYFIGNASHSVSSASTFGHNLLLRPDVVDYTPVVRALLYRLIQWCCDGAIPPEQKRPVLVPRTEALKKIKGLNIHPTTLAELLIPIGVNQSFRDLVPQVDDGFTEIGGVRMPNAAGYCGWNCVISDSQTVRPVFGFGGRAKNLTKQRSRHLHEFRSLLENGFLLREDYLVATNQVHT